ncbi:MAG: hypothetical protein WBA93_04475 [Microcoleaceae cyanobacterium]
MAQIINLSELNGSNGFIVNSRQIYNFFGEAISTADLNGDRLSSTLSLKISPAFTNCPDFIFKSLGLLRVKLIFKLRGMSLFFFSTG